jgi:hypothetical protein
MMVIKLGPRPGQAAEIQTRDHISLTRCKIDCKSATAEPHDMTTNIPRQVLVQLIGRYGLSGFLGERATEALRPPLRDPKHSIQAHGTKV